MPTTVREAGDSVISSREGTVSTTREGFIGSMVMSDSAGTAGMEAALDAGSADIDSVVIDSTRGGAGALAIGETEPASVSGVDTSSEG